MLEDVRAGREAWIKYESKDVRVASELPCTLSLSSSVVKSDARESELALALEGVATESSSE